MVTKESADDIKTQWDNFRISGEFDKLSFLIRR